MASHSSASVREPHVNQNNRTNTSNQTRHTTRTNTIVNALKQRARALLNDKSIDVRSRAILRQALERNDPWLAQLVRRADAEESIGDNNPGQPLNVDESDSREQAEALGEIICCAGDECAVALLVLMGMLHDAPDPKALANTVKHLAFTRCGELNAYGVVDAQIALIGIKLLEREIPQC